MPKALLRSTLFLRLYKKPKDLLFYKPAIFFKPISTH